MPTGRKRKTEWTVAEWAKAWAGSAPSPETAMRRRNGVRPIVEQFGDRPLESITDPELRMWAPDHQPNVRYAKGMFLAAFEDRLIPRDPSRRLKRIDKARVIVPPSEERVLAAAERALTWLDGWGPQFRSLVLMAAFSGLRVSELCDLEVRDVQQVPDARVRVRDGKGGVHREALVFEPAASALFEVLPESGPVWLRPPVRLVRDGERLSRHDVDYLWRGRPEQDGRPRVLGLRDVVGLEDCRWHDLRHFHATWLLDQGNSVEDVAVQLLGHPDPTLIVQTYGHPNLERARGRLRRRAG